MGECSGSNSLMALASESKHEITSISPPILSDLGERESSVERMEVRSGVDTIAESIEKSKCHWSQVREFDFDKEVVELSNVELFRTLQRHRTWGTFFMTFGEGEDSYGKLVMGKKFAEGGQAELYEVQIEWNDPQMIKFVEETKCEYILKVFKKGTSLQHLQSQWPQGMLQFHANKLNRKKLGLPQLVRFHCAIQGATLLEDGRFAFVMLKEGKDLRSLIDEHMLTRPSDKGPFSKDDVEIIMYDIARGMDQLHGRGIVHRDIKASNVLKSSLRIYHVADFECSIGIVGTGFFRAPEILQACKDGNVNEQTELFTKAVDVYSYGMTCYEILTGKLPFEGHPKNKYDFVIEGQRPELPSDVEDWICKLLKRCWHKNPLTRPSFGEILKVLVANSEVCRHSKLALERQEVELGIRTDSIVTNLRRSLRLVRLKMMCWIEWNLFS